jgi:uncharacterized protein with ParB-like and HNH nuclease domain
MSEQIEELKALLKKYQKELIYDVASYPIEVFVGLKALNIHNISAKDDDNPEGSKYYIPSYQRAFVWNDAEISKLIESIMLGIPIQPIFLHEQENGCFEIVDGSQRMRSIFTFYEDSGFKLSGLEKLKSLNGMGYSDLPRDIQNAYFLNRTLQLIRLNKETPETVRKDVFARLNTTGNKLKDAETRKGTFGAFYEFLVELSQNERFLKLTGLESNFEKKKTRGVEQELVTRFFAYHEDRAKFKHDVRPFLDDYVDRYDQKFESLKRKEIETLKNHFQQKFERMLDFVNTHFEYGFCKKAKKISSVPRVRFEAIAVGVLEALEINPKLAEIQKGKLDTSWVNEDKAFKKTTTADGSNSKPRLNARIEFVRDKLLATIEASAQ